MADIAVTELTALASKRLTSTDEPTSSGLRSKAILLIACALMLMFQGLKEILTSEFIMSNVFYLANNYINSTRTPECQCMQTQDE